MAVSKDFLAGARGLQDCIFICEGYHGTGRTDKGMYMSFHPMSAASAASLLLVVTTASAAAAATTVHGTPDGHGLSWRAADELINIL